MRPPALVLSGKVIRLLVEIRVLALRRVLVVSLERGGQLALRDAECRLRLGDGLPAVDEDPHPQVQALGEAAGPRGRSQPVQRGEPHELAVAAQSHAAFIYMAPAPHIVYSEELSKAFKRGHPIANPEPVVYESVGANGELTQSKPKPIAIGDVGYIQ